MQKLKLMIVDDEQAILDALYRLFRKDYQVHCFLEADLALKAFERYEYAAVISDMKMPNMTGDVFLQRVNTLSPQTTRILLTGYSDIDSTARAINLGKVSNYVNKPWDNKELKLIVENAVEQHQLHNVVGSIDRELMDENETLKDDNACLKAKLHDDEAQLSTLKKQVKSTRSQQRGMLQDVLTMLNMLTNKFEHANHSHIKRVASHCRHLANYMQLDKQTVSHSYLVGLLHEIGKLVVSEQVLNTPENKLDKDAIELRKSHAIKGAEILSTMPQLKEIAMGVKHQYESFDGTGTPSHLKAEAIPIESRILAVVNDFDKHLLGIATGETLSFDKAKNMLEKHTGHRYDPEVFKAYFELLAMPKVQFSEQFEMCISVDLLQPGMVLSRDLTNKQDAIMLTKGTEMTDQIIGRLKQYEEDWKYVFNVVVA
ncbi:response regulator [Catenovulum sp. SM1970]|uniref:HD domain-containing phosphohydrolase n=1 Tax=Marinifaba aquimaris TaxID=2741323 RepID=UPI001572D4C7|nr:HD domain-containing phosphohydrolase [Marinifaba aquimaris]NTS76153.1 response regulator [Marinifaba aquimaris]